jgi:hypothetical protein
VSRFSVVVRCHRIECKVQLTVTVTVTGYLFQSPTRKAVGFDHKSLLRSAMPSSAFVKRCSCVASHLVRTCPRVCAFSRKRVFYSHCHGGGISPKHLRRKVTHVYICTCACIRMRVCMYIRIHYIYTHTCAYIDSRKPFQINAHTYVSIRMHTDKYIHIYICICKYISYS